MLAPIGRRKAMFSENFGIYSSEKPNISPPRRKSQLSVGKSLAPPLFIKLRTKTPPPTMHNSPCKTTFLKQYRDMGRSKEMSLLFYAFFNYSNRVSANIEQQSRINSKYVIVNHWSKLVPYQHHFTQGILFYNRLLECHILKPQRPSEKIFRHRAEAWRGRMKITLNINI